MPQRISHESGPPMEWWEQVLTCGVVFHDFDCGTDSGETVRTFRCKKCGHVSDYEQKVAADGSSYWVKLGPGEYREPASAGKESLTH